MICSCLATYIYSTFKNSGSYWMSFSRWVHHSVGLWCRWQDFSVISREFFGFTVTWYVRVPRLVLYGVKHCGKGMVSSFHWGYQTMSLFDSTTEVYGRVGFGVSSAEDGWNWLFNYHCSVVDSSAYTHLETVFNIAWCRAASCAFAPRLVPVIKMWWIPRKSVPVTRMWWPAL